MLLIMAALRLEQLQELHRQIKELGMTALVEVHDETEVEVALQIAPKLIGVNVSGIISLAKSKLARMSSTLQSGSKSIRSQSAKSPNLNITESAWRFCATVVRRFSLRRL